MEAEQRIQALEKEVQILKTEIQSILLDIQTHLLTNAYPALRGHHTASSSSTQEDEDDDEYDGVVPAPKTQKVTLNNIPPKREKPTPPVDSNEPVLASLDEQQEWVLQNIQTQGLSRTRDLINGYTEKRRFSPEVSDTLMRFTNMYAAAADEPTLPSRPAGMPSGPVAVRAVSTPPVPKQPVRAASAPPVPKQPVRSPIPQQPVVQQPIKVTQKAIAPKPKAAQPPVVQRPVQPVEAPKTPETETGEPSSLVLRLIAGVQNAGAGVRWGKNKD